MAVEHFLKVLSEFHDRRGIYVVGGAVRNWLLGYPITDFDLAVKGNSHEWAEQIAGVVEGDVVNVGGDYNITRVAKDGEIIFNINGFEGSIKDDLARRDFTVNALAVPLHKWGAERTIIGNEMHIEDAELQILRPVSPTIFKDDGARLLRAFRFSKQYDLVMSSPLIDMMTDDKLHIRNAAPERVTKEFLAILEMERAFENMVDLDQHGLLMEVIPELELCRGVRQPERWHQHDVLWHQFYALRFTEKLMGGRTAYIDRQEFNLTDFSEYFDQKLADGQTRRTMMKLAALTHDIGKPKTQTFDEAKKDIHFYGHDKVGEEIMRNRLSAMKMASKNVNMICKLIRNHMRVHDILDGKATPRAIHRFCRALDEYTLDMLVLGLGDRRGHRTNMDDAEWKKYREGFNRALILSEKPANQPRAGSSFVDGKFIMRSLGIEQGPLVGELLKAVIEAEAVGEVTSKDDAYLLMERMVFAGNQNEEAKNV